MKILLVGAGGVGAAFAAIAARRDYFETIVVTDYDLSKAERAASADDRFVAAQVDASSAESVADLVPSRQEQPVPFAVSGCRKG